jgi:hypothetical protein
MTSLVTFFLISSIGFLSMFWVFIGVVYLLTPIYWVFNRHKD